jgi:hypothetical protein
MNPVDDGVSITTSHEDRIGHRHLAGKDPLPGSLTGSDPVEAPGSFGIRVGERD